MPARDNPEDIRAKLQHWYRERVCLTDAVVTRLKTPASGVVNETYLHVVTHSKADESVSLPAVLRVQPAVETPIPDVDVNQQAFVLNQLHPLVHIPTPRVLWNETNPQWLGRAFYVMEEMRGEAIFDAWEIPADADVLLSMYRQTISVLARIHAVDWRRAGLEPLCMCSAGISPLEAQLDAYRLHLDRESVDKNYPLLETALEELRDTLPAMSPPVLNWGDARIGNLLFDGPELTAVLDWEIAEITAREVDIGWFVFFERFFCKDGIDERPGAMSAREIIQFYEHEAGVELLDLDWFQRWAAFRLAVMRLRAGRQAIQRGEESAASRVDEVNFATVEMARVFGYPEPF